MNVNKLIMVFCVMSTILCGCQKENKQIVTDKSIVAENDSVAILYQVVDPAKDEYDIPEVAIWIKNKTTE